MGNLRKSLELSEILQKQPGVREHAKTVKEDAEKEMVAKAMWKSYSNTAKYRAIKTIETLCSWKRLNSSQKRHFKMYERKREWTYRDVNGLLVHSSVMIDIG